MISRSIVLILSISSLSFVFKRFFGINSLIDFNCCLGIKDCKATACFNH